jgi:hypothetical protein
VTLLQETSLVYLDLSNARDKVWCPEHMDKCLASEPYIQSSGEKLNLNPVTTLCCLNIENISTERILVVKISDQ